MSKHSMPATSAVLPFVFAIWLAAPAFAADLNLCKKTCGTAYGQCIQANPDPDVFEKTCTPKRDQCLAACETQATKSKLQPVQFVPRKLSAPSKTTQLFWNAFERKNYEMMDLLLQQGADINCENCHSSGFTPLMRAAEGTWNPSAFRMVDYLVSKGADINYQNNAGHTALMALSGKVSSTDRHNTSASESIGLLLSHGADVRLKDKNGDTALHFLAESGTGYSGGAYKHWTRFLNQYVASGAEINLKNRKGVTPLMILVRHCEPNAVRDFMANGADASIKSLAGDTALSLAIENASRRSDKSCNEVVSVLSNPGANTLASGSASDTTTSQQTGTDSLMNSLKKLDESLKQINK